MSEYCPLNNHAGITKWLDGWLVVRQGTLSVLNPLYRRIRIFNFWSTDGVELVVTEFDAEYK